MPCLTDFMHEETACTERAPDMERLQALLDRSYAAAGEHLRSIVTPERRMPAGKRSNCSRGSGCWRCDGHRDGRPLVGAVDGFFYRGSSGFGSSPDSLRFRHIRERPDVSATHTPSEAYSVTVHGRAEIVDLSLPEHAGFVDYRVEFYGEEWLEWGDGAVYARIDADRMFTFRFGEGSVHHSSPAL